MRQEKFLLKRNNFAFNCYFSTGIFLKVIIYAYIEFIGKVIIILLYLIVNNETIPYKLIIYVLINIFNTL